MTPHPDDTIIALASAPGPGRRAIVRLSGPGAGAAIATVFEPFPVERRLTQGKLRFAGINSPLPTDLYFSKAPRSYTGQDTAELHLVSSPPLVEALIAALLNAGTRPAQPGEFTLRAFLHGKKDLTQAEAVLGVIEATHAEELKQSLTQLAGGMTRPLQGLRDDLLNLLADVEAGLDFAEEDIQFVDKKDLLGRIAAGMAQLTNLSRQIDSRSLSGKPLRAVLVGEPNSGKSSLFNALAGLPAAIVSPVAGTTRDYLSRSVKLGDTTVELVDTAGWQEAGHAIERQAQDLGKSQADSADLLLWCVPAGEALPVPVAITKKIPTIVVRTKSDLSSDLGEWSTSAETGAGVADLKAELGERAWAHASPALAPSLSRCKHHVAAALKSLRAAHSSVLFDDPPDLLALELRLALEQIGEMVGAVYTDDLLDRIFSRFCIGK